MVHVGEYQFSLWLFNIAIENGPVDSRLILMICIDLPEFWWFALIYLSKKMSQEWWISSSLRQIDGNVGKMVNIYLLCQIGIGSERVNFLRTSLVSHRRVTLLNCSPLPPILFIRPRNPGFVVNLVILGYLIWSRHGMLLLLLVHVGAILFPSNYWCLLRNVLILLVITWSKSSVRYTWL